MSPRLTVGLPTFNGERFLPEALDSLLRQTYRDFELIISDNASTDATQAICERYARADPRIRYFRQDTNIGAAANHNFVVEQARGEFFKWASDDDLYHEDLLTRCVELLDGDPTAVVAHAHDAFVDDQSRLLNETTYRLRTSSPSAVRRFRSLLYGRGGNDFYGVIRSDVLRRTHLHGSYHNADRTIVAELALHGRFIHSAEVLYFRRDHVDRSERPTGRPTDDRPARDDGPPWAVLMLEYVAAFFEIIRTAPLDWRQKTACYLNLGAFVVSRAVPVHRLGDASSEDPAIRDRASQSRLVRAWNRHGWGRDGSPTASVATTPRQRVQLVASTQGHR